VLVIHRDIKPDNLLIAVDSSGHQTVKYIDVGLAVELNDRESTIDDGKKAGTPSYMSPELDARKAYSFATDTWSLGVVLLQVGSWGGILSSFKTGR
jgi:serine/threonine protein kinase